MKYFPEACNELTFEANNGEHIIVAQWGHDNRVMITNGYPKEGTVGKDRIIIPPNDFVMLINMYKYIKANDIRNSFINPNGKEKEVL